MPVPGPRTQQGPDPGYRNPGMEPPVLFNHWDRPGPVTDPGRSPGTMFVNLRGCVLAAGQIRRFWRQTIQYIPGPPAYSTTANGVSGPPPPPFQITRALRYMTRSVYMGGGIDNSRFAGLHTEIKPKVRSKQVTIAAGSVRGRPTVRNRMTSFGSRVPTLNSPVDA